MVAPTLLAEPHLAGTEKTWNTLVDEDYAVVPAAATVSNLASATDVDDENVLPWHPDDEYASGVLFGVISSRGVLTPPEKTVKGSRPAAHSIHRPREEGVRREYDNLLV